MVTAVALGVAVVLAIDLAGNAAAGSFRSSMETLAGDNDLEVTAAGGVPEAIVGTVGAAAVSAAHQPAHRRPCHDGVYRRGCSLIGIDFVAEATTAAAEARSSPPAEKFRAPQRS